MKLKIERSRWLRGEGTYQSYLKRKSDGKMCCLGFYCLAIGHSLEDILDKQGPRHLYLQGGLISTGNWLIDQNDKFRSASTDGSLLIYKNDSMVIPEEEREREIAEIFARHDVEVEFV